MNTFENGQIVVATRKQLTDCGLLIVHEGAIIMVADNKEDNWGYIKVWKSLDRKQCNKTTDVKPDLLRLADESEGRCFFAGIRNINELKLKQ